MRNVVLRSTVVLLGNEQLALTMTLKSQPEAQARRRRR